jgi:Protein of unknown function (DUF4242)
MRYLVESYLPATGAPEQLERVAARSRAAAAELAREGAVLRYIEAILVPEDEMCLLVYEAESPDLAAEASARAGIAFDRVLRATGDLDSRQGGKK